MADILIRGMDMPNKDEILVFDVWHGKVYARSTANTGTRRYEVVPLPEGHGRLIDADALFEVMGQDTERWLIDDISYIETDDAISAVYKAPTIVPAEGGTDNG